MGDEDSEYGVSKRYCAPVLSERAGATGMQEELAMLQWPPGQWKLMMMWLAIE
jgi:hypothetical protein